MPLLPQILLIEVLTALAALHPPPEEPIALEPSPTRYIEVTWAETVIHGRPWIPFRRIATLSRGTRLTVRGMVTSRDSAGCSGKPWYAVYPFGYVCSTHARPSEQPPSAALALPLEPGRRLPFAYAFVREDGAPMYASLADVESGNVARELTKGMSLVVERTVDAGGRRFVVTTDGAHVAKDDVRWAGQGSEWSGHTVDGLSPGPAFAWVTDTTSVRAQPSLLSPVVRKLDRRARVPLHEHNGAVGRQRWWRVGDDEWVEANRLNEVHVVVPPPGVVESDRVERTGNDQWIDVDVGEQVLVAYRGSDPVYATLISSGRSHGTPLGNYPIWAKVASMAMANQDYEDKPYLVEGVPWVLLFQGHNAIHGAYWHDRFGVRKSHGCVNLSPIDARWLFEWVAPALPEGWTGYLPAELDSSIVVHVRDSSKAEGEQFTQERPIGPPDPDEERKKLEAAAARREAQALTESMASTPNPLHDAPLQGERIEPPPPPDLLGDGT